MATFSECHIAGSASSIWSYDVFGPHDRKFRRAQLSI